MGRILAHLLLALVIAAGVNFVAWVVVTVLYKVGML